MNANEIINIVKESILSEIQNNPTIIQYVKEISHIMVATTVIEVGQVEVSG